MKQNINHHNRTQYACIHISLPKCNYLLLLGRLRREFQAFTLAPPKAYVIPIRYLMLVNTNSAGACISTCIKVRHTTDSDTGIGNGVFRERANLFQHPLWGTDPFTDKDFIRTPFSSPRALQPLLFCTPLLHPKSLSCNNHRDRSTQKGPPNFPHHWYTTSAAPSSSSYAPHS